jgi:hypothetical protein
LGTFLKIKELAHILGQLFFLGKSYEFALAKNGLGFILGVKLIWSPCCQAGTDEVYILTVGNLDVDI